MWRRNLRYCFVWLCMMWILQSKIMILFKNSISTNPWEMKAICFNSIHPFPLLLLSPPSLPPLHTHPTLSFLFFFCPSLSLICVIQLLFGWDPPWCVVTLLGVTQSKKTDSPGVQLLVCILPWSVLTLLGVTQSKTTDSSSPSRNQMSTVPQRGVGLAHLLTPHAGICLSLGCVSVFRITANSCVKLPTVPREWFSRRCLLPTGSFNLSDPFLHDAYTWEEGNDLSIIFRVEHSSLLFSPGLPV